ncbi:hypothetical protein ACFWHT_11625 [Microbacterium sp. NPDC058342]|uniref:hypothetical protein n=1 Tax=Microbacterium sp. NPDC058342 TaxID=3346454 RepID=UPI00365E6623
MSDQQQGQDAGQRPHTPGQDPSGSGEPRQAGGHTGAPEDIPEHNTAPDGQPGTDEDAPLGGDETTEEQLVADTAVEADALKGLDPDDTPA